MTRPNPRLAKLHRSYTVEEVARLYGTHRNTVRAWCKAGLPLIDGHRPFLIQGEALRTFLQDRRDRAKRPCTPGTLYCCKCRAPCAPADGSAVFVAHAIRAGTLRALCAVCGTRMFRRAREDDLETIMPRIAVRIVEASLHIAECTSLSPNCDERQDGQPMPDTTPLEDMAAPAVGQEGEGKSLRPLCPDRCVHRP
jgi:hypothetical protein